MDLYLDHHKVHANTNETLKDLVVRLGLETDSLKTRPLAARISGETFTLNYIPRRTDCEVRKALREGDGVISLIRYDSPRGKRLYERTQLFVFFYVCRRLFPEATVKVEFTVANGLYITVEKNGGLSEADCRALKEEYARVVREDRKILRKRYTIQEATEHFTKENQPDKVRLLRWRQFTYFDAFHMEGEEDYIEYLYGELAPSTGYEAVFDLIYSAPGLMLMFPSEENPDVPAEHVPLPRLTRALEECNEWGRLMECSVIADLNDMTENGSIRQLIRTNEALHEKHFAEIAQQIIGKDAKIVLMAGPSSSGKTTSANRLCTQLRVHGKKPILISLDDYYIDRDKLTPDENGQYDLEHLNTIDVARFHADLKDILAGKSVELPRFDFIAQRSVKSGHVVQLAEDTVFVIEGLHGLNPALIPEEIDRSRLYKIYVSALITLNVDLHNRIPTTYVRLLRRMVRDHMTRGSSVENTLSMWQSIRRGEKRWIFPYQEDVDVMINTSTVYEIAVLKKHIFPLLLEVAPDSPYYDEVRSIVKFLNYTLEADVDFEIPPTSIIREFIGGNTFYIS